MADGGAGTVNIGGVDIEVLAGVGRFERDMVRVEQRGKRAGNTLTQQFDRADQAAQRLEATLKRGASALALFGGAYAAGNLLQNIIDTADSMTLLRGRIENVISANENLAAVERDLFNAAQQNRQGLVETATLYLRLRQSIRELNHEQALSLSSTYAQTLVISGASASEAAAATLQFAQAMASGRLQGDELRSILENNSRFALLLANNLGVTVGQLKSLGEAGALTSGVIASAMADQATTIESEFQNIDLTVGQAMTQLRNALMSYIGETDQSLGASQRIAQGISMLTANVDKLADALIAIGSGLVLGGAIAGVGTFTSALVAALQVMAFANNPAAKAARAFEDFANDVVAAEARMVQAKLKHEIADQKLADAINRNANNRSLAQFRRREREAVQALTLATENYAAAERRAATAAQVHAQATTGLRGAMNSAAGVARGLGANLLAAFGGPVGLAITAAGVAMSVFTYNALQAQRISSKLAEDLQRLEPIYRQQATLTRELQAANEELEKAIKSQGPTAIATANLEIQAINERIKKNKELAKVYRDRAEANLATLEAADRRKDSSNRKDNLANAFAVYAENPDILSKEDAAALQKYIEDRTSVFSLYSGSVEDDQAKRIIEAARDEVRRQLDRGDSVSKSGRALLNKLADEAERDQEIADTKRQLAALDRIANGQEPEDVETLLTDAEKARQQYDKAIEAVRASSQGDKTKSALAASALKTLAESDLAAAKAALPDIKDLLSPADLLSVEKAMKKLSITTITTKKGLNEFSTAAEKFKATIDEIRKNPDATASEKSRAATQALIDYGRELKNIPDAMAAIPELSDILKPADAELARQAIAKVANEAADRFGEDMVIAMRRYKKALDEINTAEAAVKALGKPYNQGQFDAARAAARKEYNDSVASSTDHLDELRALIEQTRTPTERLNDALSELNRLSSQIGENSYGQIAIARKRIDLLEEEARATGYAGDALKQLRMLQGTAGYSDAEVRQREQAIREAARAGRQGLTYGEMTPEQRSEAAADIFATSFQQGIIAAVQSGDFGEAFKSVIAQKFTEAFADGILNIGQYIGDSIFGTGGIFSGAFGLGQGTVDSAGVEALGTAAAGAATETEALAGLFGGTMASSAIESATSNTGQAVSSEISATSLATLAIAAQAAAAALAEVAASQAAEGITSLFGSGLSQAAHGGAGKAGVPMIVGEGGRELFIPGADGYVVPNYALKGSSGMRAGGGGGTQIRMGDIIVQGDATENTRRLIAEEQARAAQQLPRLIKREVVKLEERRPK